MPYQDSLSTLIHEPSFKQTAGEAVFSKAKVIVNLGNRAVQPHYAVARRDQINCIGSLIANKRIAVFLIST
jgi:type I restriction enzyme, R subunit